MPREGCSAALVPPGHLLASCTAGNMLQPVWLSGVGPWLKGRKDRNTACYLSLSYLATWPGLVPPVASQLLQPVWLTVVSSKRALDCEKHCRVIVTGLWGSHKPSSNLEGSNCDSFWDHVNKLSYPNHLRACWHPSGYPSGYPQVWVSSSMYYVKCFPRTCIV